MKQIKFPSNLVPVFIGIGLLVLLSSCPDKKSGISGTDSLNVDTSTAEASAIKGTWVVKRYYLADMSAMDENTASEWLNKKLFIDDKLHFDFSEIKSYTAYFRNENECDMPAIDSPEVMPATEYFDAGRGVITDLNLESSTLNVYHTSCKDHPFEEFILTDRNELIVSWDGAFFVLVREGTSI